MSSYLERIQHFERIARRLEPDSEDRRKMSGPVFRYAEQFLDTVNDKQAFVVPAPGVEDGRPISFSEEPEEVGAVLKWIGEKVDRPGLNPASGGHLAYIPGGGIYPASLGDYLAAVTNRYAGVHFAGPGAIRVEKTLIDWMAKLAGLPATAAGDLTSGGSIANLIGIVSAREAFKIPARDFHRAVVYMTRHVHHSLEKALGIAGMKESVLRFVEVDDRYRMRTDALEAAVSGDKKTGLLPWMVIASAGTTDTGAIDPMDRIGEIAREHGLWYHIDAAYGGFFLLCKGGSTLLQGINMGDSIVMDPHKGLFLPYGSGAVLVKDGEILRRAHTYEANYMQDAREDQDRFSPADHSPELTRHFRGMRLWLPIKLFGLAPFRACLEEKRLLARYFHERIGEIDRFEVGPPPELSVVTYRYLPRRGDPDDFNRRLIREVRKDGRVFLSSTMLDGKFVLRLAVLSFRTHLRQIDLALKILQEKVRTLTGEA